MVSGVRFVGDAAGFASTVDAEDPRGQLGRGWLPAEDVNGRRARWMRERADLLLRGTAGELRVEAMLPPGLPPGRLQALVDGADAGTRALPADGAWRSLTFARVTASGLARVELRAPTATPAPGDAAAHPRRFGALVARVGF
jgi:hypothetical protein